MTTVDASRGVIAMPPLIEASALKSDRGALMALMEREGYLFFRDVLDRDLLADLKRSFMDVVIGMGVVDEGAHEPIWNGADLSDFPFKFEQLHDVRVWQRFAAHPRINAFFRELLGEEPFWLPIVEYRIFPPRQAPTEDPFFGRHQDGFYNGDLDCWTCWVPLVDVDEAMGGLAMASGQHKRGYLHDTEAPPQYYIPGDALPADCWRRSAYQAGDVVVFNRWIPHCGMDNFSDHFRLSMDIRVMPKSGALPVWGKVKSFTPRAIAVENHDGRTVTLAVDENTYSRWTGGKRIETEELIKLIPPGDEVLAFHADGRATMLRPPR